MMAVDVCYEKHIAKYAPLDEAAPVVVQAVRIACKDEEANAAALYYKEIRGVGSAEKAREAAQGLVYKGHAASLLRKVMAYRAAKKAR